MCRKSQAGGSAKRVEECYSVPPRAGEAAVRISVIIPVYNAEFTVARAINSVFEQEFDDFEVIAVDDGSTDRSLDILRPYVHRIKLCRQCNRGPAAARNAGARLAVGEYLAFLDADDEWLPGKLRACVEALDGSPNAVVAYSDMRGTDGKNLRLMIGSPTLEQLLSQPFSLFPSAAVMRRQAFESCRGFSEEFKRPFGEDTFMGLRLRELGEFIHIPQPLVIYHGSGASTSAAKYSGGYKTFTRLAKERYGRRSKGVRTHVRRYYCRLLLGAALEDLKEHSFSSVLLDLTKAAIVSPGFVLCCLFDKVRKIMRVQETNENDRD